MEINEGSWGFGTRKLDVGCFTRVTGREREKKKISFFNFLSAKIN